MPRYQPQGQLDSKFYCVKMDIEFLCQMVDEYRINPFDNKAITREQTLRLAGEFKTEMENKGIKWIPRCSNQTPNGECLGHDNL